MNTTPDIKIWELALGFSLLLFPLAFFLKYKIKLYRDVLINATRMAIQLGLVGVYLEVLFKLNKAWINTAWVAIMVLVGVFTITGRVALNRRYFLLPLALAGLTSLLIVDAFCLGFILKLDYLFDARYFIPITGMVLGNALNHNIVGLNSFFKGLREKQELFRFLLTNTGNKSIALRPFIEEAAHTALNPLIANMSVIGLVTLPGMMTGQLLGGSSPAVAIKYQIMIMLAIFVGCTINIFLSILFSKRIIFDAFGNLKPQLFVSNK